ncbi:hypothetical protein CPB83DRAFT_515011 [Crepidotus variabilis]|uniref:MYND-type domain-containing protein n=1 Tax=Crepidotus variabilis TaxID=179855 RepID=A0A9P6EB83_9AGAR|nr:hypothetical protein CPB83DRAFT_515011 [Crepidotus variabilis]
MSGCTMLSKYITTSGQQGHIVIYHLLSKPFVPQLFSSIFLLLTKPDSPSLLPLNLSRALDIWEQLLNQIKHATSCRQGGCWLAGLSKLLDLTRQIFELIYYETIPGIREAPTISKLGSRILQLWQDSSIFYGITERTVLERYKFLKKCCNPTCTQRLKRVQKMKKFRCLACHTVFYCSRECQKLDWKTHHLNCDASAFATRESLQQMYAEPPAPLQADHMYHYAPLTNPLVQHCHHMRLRSDSSGF